MKYSSIKTLGVLLLLAGSFGPAFSQIVVFHSRYVPEENIQNFIDRETVYWSVAATLMSLLATLTIPPVGECYLGLL